MSNATVDIQHTTFKGKIIDYLGKLGTDLESCKEEVGFHKLIVETFETNGIEHIHIDTLKDSIKESEKLIKVLEDKQIQGNKLQEFLNGDLVLDFNKFVFLMIDVIGSQMVNYVELKNEFEAVSKLWTTDKK